MNITIKRSPKRRSVAIKISPKGEIFVLCPKYYTDFEVDNLIQKKQKWIQNTVNNINKKLLLYSDFYTYQKYLYLGEIHTNTENYKQKQIEKWLKEQAKIQLLTRLKELSLITTKLKYDSAKIISARKKWGSCSSTKEIRLNYRLIMLSYDCIDYVCIHELCHLKHMNHSKNFWKLVESFVPNYKILKKKISENNFVLELF